MTRRVPIREAPARALAIAMVLASLAGCTTPIETRGAISEMNRLCEAESGTRVYQPTKWPSKLERGVYSECPDQSGQRCFNYSAASLFAKSEVETLQTSNVSGLQRVRVKFLDSHDGSLVADRVDFQTHGENGPIADDRFQTRGCKASQLSRIVPHGEPPK